MNRRIKKKQHRQQVARMVERMKPFQGVLLLNDEYVLFDIRKAEFALTSDEETTADVVAVFRKWR